MDVQHIFLIIMETFLDENFLLHSETARKLYHEHAERMPIIDYHCHLDPRMVADDYHFRSITELWLGGDHYKWRAMRANGVPEHYITGQATDWEKFEKWAETVPCTLRNPLFHWTCLELKTAFGIDTLLTPDTARDIYEACNELLNQPGYTARGLMRRYHVEAVCTTDDPVDTLEHHIRTRESGFEVKMLPAWRPDKVMAVEDIPAFRSYIGKLGEASGMSIASYDDLLKALRIRHRFFHEQGCRLSDHGLDRFYSDKYTDSEVRRIFLKAYGGDMLTPEEVGKFKSAMLLELAEMDWERGWTQQYHFGALRNNRTKMYQDYGPDAGCDSIGEWHTAREMSAFFDTLDRRGHLAKTIVYNLNPSASTMVAVMLGNFQDGSVPGKMQYGAAWWFLDQKDGIERQLNVLSMQGLLSRFVGMLTDSRSFLSYPRHEYFRRILCNLLGTDVENGELPASWLPRLGRMVEDIAYNNAKSYLSF